MNKIVLRSFIIFVFLLCTVTLFASETGEIRGLVIDEEGEPLPGVVITAQSPRLQGLRTAVTDEKGFFKLPLLPVGVYSLTFELDGFTKTIQSGYNVRLGFTLSIEVELKMATIAEEVVVTAEQPLIDKTNVDTSYRTNADDLNHAPVQGRTVEEIVAYTPGVTGVRSSTYQGTGTGLPSFRGEGEEGNNWLIDGLSVRGSEFNDPGVTINYDAWEEVQIVSDGFSPDWGQALGGTINIVTKSGGNDFDGEIGALVRNWHLMADRKPQLSLATEPNTNHNHFFGNLGGPIIKDKLWFFFSNNFFSRADFSNEQSIGWLTYPAGERQLKTNNFFGKITYTPQKNHTLSLSGNWDAFMSQKGGTGLPELYIKDDYSNTSFRINHRGILSSDTIIESAFGQFIRDSKTIPLEEDFGPPTYFWLDIGQYTNNADGTWALTERRTDFSTRLTHYLDFRGLGNHEISAGFAYFYTYSESEARWTGEDLDLWKGNGFDNGTELDWLEPGIPYNIWELGDYGYNNATRGISLYLMDSFTIGNFSFMLGLRTDTQTLLDNEGQEIWSWGLGDFLSPRVSTAIDLSGNGKNILKFGYGKFSNTFSTQILRFYNRTGGDSFRVYEWTGNNNPTEQQLTDPTNWEFSFEQSPEAMPSEVDPNIKPNSTEKFLLEFSRQLGTSWAVKLRGILSYSRNLTEWVAVYDPETIYKSYLTNFELKKRDYRAIELELNGKITDKLTFHASYTWSEAKGTTPGQFELGSWASPWGYWNEAGAFGDHPNLPEGHPDKELYDFLYGGLGGRGIGDEGWYGFLPYSIDHQIKIFGTYFAPFDFVISTFIEYNSGYHWERKGLAQGYGLYITFPEGRGGRKTPGHWFWDLSVERNFALTQGFVLGLRLNFLNILNSQRPVAYVREDTSLFGEIYSRQQPRWLQLQISLKF